MNWLAGDSITGRDINRVALRSVIVPDNSEKETARIRVTDVAGDENAIRLARAPLKEVVRRKAARD